MRGTFAARARACATGALLFVMAAGTCAGAASASADPSALVLSAHRSTGYENVTVAGPAGATVGLFEQAAGALRPITTVTLSGSGLARVPHALAWQCSPLTRTLVASSASVAGGAPVTLTLSTPPCTSRLAVALPRSATVTRYRMVAVRDRWGTGALGVTVCEQPPGGLTTCRSQTLAAGQASTRVRLDLPRPGGYAVTVYGQDGTHHRQLVWVSHPDRQITLLAAGDSEMQGLDDDLRADLAPDHVRVVEDAQPSTGLTVPMDLNWQKRAGRLARAVHPDVTVVSMGANEGYATPGPSGGLVNCCGAAWTAGYGQLVYQMAETLLQDHRGQVYWFVLPTPKPPNFQQVFDSVNAGITLAAARLPGRMGLIDANAFFTPNNVYRDQMTYDGQRFTIHEPDGIHLDAAADAVAAQLVVQRLRADRVLRP